MSPAVAGPDPSPAEPGGSTAPVPPGRLPAGSWRRTVIEWVAVIAAVVVAAVVLRSFVVQLYYIPSASMEPTLQIGDKVLVDKLSYDLHGVHRGDVVVFDKPPGDHDPGVSVLIKRVVGLPGETISARNGQVYIDGAVLAQPWLPKGITTPAFGPDYVPAGCYFMLGDNRGDSADSRVIGCIPRRLIIGRAVAVVWPPSQIRSL